MSTDAMLPCIVCGTVLRNVMRDTENQPSEGTEFTSYGHYGSTFWDAFHGEQIVINICDACLRKHTDRIARRRRYVNLVVDDPRGKVSIPTLVGRQWILREMVPYFDGPEDTDQVSIEPEEIGVLDRQADGYRSIEWVANWRDIKAEIMAELRAQEQGGGPCFHTRFVAECLDCGAQPLQGLN